MDKRGYWVGFVEDGMRHPGKHRHLPCFTREVDKKQCILDLLFVIRTKIARANRHCIHLQRGRIKTQQEGKSVIVAGVGIDDDAANAVNPRL